MDNKKSIRQTVGRGRYKKRKLWLTLLLGCTSLIALCVLADFYVGSFAKGRLYCDASQTPYRRGALLLGCSKHAYGRQNLYYQYRINAALELWNAGKIDAILVSGDNSTKEYDEPGDMKQDLIQRGIPAEYITLDAAGFRTLDSVVRAQEIFGLEDYIVISQPFHCQRAIFLAGKNGQSVIGFCAAEPQGALSAKVRLREVAARTKAVVDVLISKSPKFLGRREAVHYRRRVHVKEPSQ